MDNSWLLEEDSCTVESESDEEEKEKELESRLYSVIHHNDLSQPLPASLSEQFSVECSDTGEVVISLKKPIDDLLANVNVGAKDEAGTNDDDDVVIINEVTPASEDRRTVETPVFRKKRFRYSDINIDEENILNGTVDSVVPQGDTNAEINYFKSVKLRGRDRMRFREIKLPTDTTLPVQDWKSHSNLHYISVRKNFIDPIDFNIVRAMTDVLRKVNPNVGKNRLKEYARLLYQRNRTPGQLNDSTHQNYKKDNQHSNQQTPNKNYFESKEFNQNPIGSSSDYLASKDEDVNSNRNDPVANGINAYSMKSCEVIEIEDDESHKISVETPKSTRKSKKNNKGTENPFRTGCISLNISSFKPMANSSSDDEDCKSSVPDTPNSNKPSRNNLPHKWTKEMVKFYMTPSKRKLNQSIEQIHSRLNDQSGPEDWELNKKDEVGVALFRSSNVWTMKCNKCGHRGHDPRTCKHKAKCYLCAETNHACHNCPNTPCLTCGESGIALGMDQECRNCYMMYMNNEACQVCLSHDHHTGVCPDSWRSFHATIEGEKKIPNTELVNPRRWCCNCASRGHFSHQCPAPVFSKQPSPFVVNYLHGSHKGGSINITLPPECYGIMNDYQADYFLQSLSNRTGVCLEFGEGREETVIRASGSFEKCNYVKREIEQYVNIKKRRLAQPTFKNKRRKLR